MAPLPTAQITSDAEVIGFVREHVRREHPSFAGEGRAARRRRRRAEAAAGLVLEWWRVRGDRTCQGFRSLARYRDECVLEAEEHVAAGLGGLLISIFGPIVLGWVERLVVRLLIDWLTGQGSVEYRAALAGRSGPIGSF